jgi:hypothetical protein
VIGKSHQLTEQIGEGDAPKRGTGAVLDLPESIWAQHTLEQARCQGFDDLIEHTIRPVWRYVRDDIGDGARTVVNERSYRHIGKPGIEAARCQPLDELTEQVIRFLQRRDRARGWRRRWHISVAYLRERLASALWCKRAGGDITPRNTEEVKRRHQIGSAQRGKWIATLE